MRRDVAEQLQLLVMQFTGRLMESLALVEDTCTRLEIDAHRSAVARIIADVDSLIQEPIQREHPDLLPEPMGGPYRIDPAIYEPHFYIRRTCNTDPNDTG